MKCVLCLLFTDLEVCTVGTNCTRGLQQRPQSQGFFNDLRKTKTDRPTPAKTCIDFKFFLYFFLYDIGSYRLLLSLYIRTNSCQQTNYGKSNQQQINQVISLSLISFSGKNCQNNDNHIYLIQRYSSCGVNLHEVSMGVCAENNPQVKFS